MIKYIYKLNVLKIVIINYKAIYALPTVINSASILSLKLDEIKERTEYILSTGGSIVLNDRFNSIYGLSRKSYQERAKVLTKS